MRQTITKIRGLTVNIEIIEVSHKDLHGGTIWYHAAIWVQRHGSVEKTLVRKSRLPGAAAELRKEIQRDGLRAFDRLID
jgi:hypothetical protein